MLSSFFGGGVGFGCSVAVVIVAGFFAGDLVSAGFDSGTAVGCGSGVGCSTGGGGGSVTAAAGVEIVVALTGAGALRRVET